MGMLPRLGHVAAKAKVAPMGRQPRHARVHAAKAKAMASPMDKQSMPRHAVKAMACLHGHVGMPLGVGSKALGGMQPKGQWKHGEVVACPVGGMLRPWHALRTPRRP